MGLKGNDILNLAERTRDYRENLILRKFSSAFLFVVGLCLFVFSIAFYRASLVYRVLYLLLFAMAGIDLYIISKAYGAAQQVGQYFVSWSLFYGVFLLLWALFYNSPEVDRGRANITFFTIVSLVAVTIRVKPMISVTLITSCFLLNYGVSIFHFGFDFSFSLAYLMFWFVDVFIASALYMERSAIIEARSKEKKKATELEVTARTDSLTGVGNRMYADSVIDRYWENGTVFSLAVIDIDRLKYCNDNFGHREGDRYIKSLCRFLEGVKRDGESIFRFGGDEFLYISTRANDVELSSFLLLVSDEYAKSEPDLGYRRGFSFGTALIDPSSGQSYSAMFSEADNKMYALKMASRAEWEYKNEGDETGYGLDKSGLESKIFTVLSSSLRNQYTYIINLKTNVSRWSVNAVEHFGLPGEYLYDPKSVLISHIHPDDRKAYLDDFEAVLSGKKERQDFTCRIKSKSGQYVTCKCEGIVVKGTGGDADFFSGAIMNLGVVDVVDRITGMKNTYSFLSDLLKLKGSPKPVGILEVDIQRFHSINNVFGYGVGNCVLSLFAGELESMAPSSVYRMDGAKFAILSTGKDVDYFKGIFKKAQEIARSRIKVESTDIPFLISGALLYFSEISVSPDTIVSELEYALTKSKTERGGALVFYDDLVHGRAKTQIARLDEVRRATLYGCSGFYLDYQPQTLKDGSLVAVEALLRWKDKDGNVVMPGEFIDFLENDNCFDILGSWILKSALEETKPLVDKHPTLKVSVNISYRQLTSQSFRPYLLNLLADTGFSPKNLIIELTEHCSTLDVAYLSSEVEYFRSKGISVAADDFGIGYSNLSQLNNLSFNVIKIDQSFVNQIKYNKRGRLIVETTIRLAHTLGMDVCAEGVENTEQIDVLNLLGADMYQGYYFSPPCSLGKLMEYVEKHGVV